MVDHQGSSVLSHPEILGHEKLVDILSSRGLPKEELTIKEKDVLVEMFYRFVVPLPQRTTNMRRANRLKKKLSPIKMPKPADKESKPGCKRCDIVISGLNLVSAFLCCSLSIEGE